MKTYSYLFLILTTLFVVYPSSKAAPTYREISTAKRTVLTEMQRLQKQHGIHFVYDSALRLDMPYTGTDLSHLPIDKALNALFGHIGIEYKIHNRNVMLRQTTASLQQTTEIKERKTTFTINGRITDTQGEPIVNATVFDLTSKDGTLSDGRGRYIIHLAEGHHVVRVSSIGCDADTIVVNMHSDISHNFRLKQTVELKEVVVTEDMNSPVLTTQTGKRTFTPKDINNGFALLSSPDLVKTIQRTSGVTAGVDLVSGLYVHGGGSDENLYLLDGTPLYQTNHSLGLFSASTPTLSRMLTSTKVDFRHAIRAVCRQ